MDMIVSVRTRRQASQFDPNTGQQRIGLEVIDHDVSVTIAPNLPESSWAGAASAIAESMMRAQYPNLAKLTFHGVRRASVDTGNAGLDGGASEAGARSAKSLVDGRGSWARTAPRSNGRFVKAG